MLIFAEQNVVVTSKNESFLSNGNITKVENSNFFNAFYPDDTLPQTAIVSNGKILKSKGVYTADYLGEPLICFKRMPRYTCFTLLTQTTIDDIKVTIYGDETLKVVIESPTYTEIFSYNYFTLSVKIQRTYTPSGITLGVLLVDENKCLIYKIDKSRIIEKACLSANTVEFNADIVATKKHHDVLAHTVTTTYDSENIEVISRKSTAEKSHYSLLPELIPIAFFEEILSYGNYAEMLSSNLQKNADLIPAYLKKFIKAIPLTDGVGLVYLSTKNSDYDYIVRKCVATVNDYKITNITLF